MLFDAPAGPVAAAAATAAAAAAAAAAVVVETGTGTPGVEPTALGELLALLGLAGLALLGSELAGVGWSRSADRLALLMPPPFASD